MNKVFIPLLTLASLLPPLSLAEGLLLYKPPQTGAPQLRVGGGTRGLNLNSSEIQLLAPRHAALTGQSQPVLYWYLSKPNSQEIAIKLVKKGIEKPLWEKKVPALSATGLQSIRLGDYGVSLQDGEEYRWSVSVTDDADRQSADAANAASLRYQLPPTFLLNVEQLAEAGYWYDALQQLIESHSPRTANLLQQIGIDIPGL